MRKWGDIFNLMKEKNNPANQEYFTQKSGPLEMNKRQRLFQTNKS